jgi:hypothetical protein
MLTGSTKVIFTMRATPARFVASCPVKPNERGTHMRSMHTKRVLLLFALLTTQAFAVKFKHIILVVQENRTPDKLFGSNPAFEQGVDIGTRGKTSTGVTVTLAPVNLASCYDVSHSHRSFRVSYDGGLMNGFDREPIYLSQW